MYGKSTRRDYMEWTSSQAASGEILTNASWVLEHYLLLPLKRISQVWEGKKVCLLCGQEGHVLSDNHLYLWQIDIRMLRKNEQISQQRNRISCRSIFCGSHSARFTSMWYFLLACYHLLIPALFCFSVNHVPREPTLSPKSHCTSDTAVVLAWFERVRVVSLY